MDAFYFMPGFIRFESSENIFYALKNEKNNIKSLPSIERDLFLKSAIKNCFDYLKELLRTNRNDFNTGQIKKYIPISFIRKTIDEGVDNIKYTHEINTIEKQEIFSNLIADVYTKYEGDKEAFCNENVYLFFNKMRLEGISKDLIRVVRFYNYDNYNDHVVILYSSSTSLFNKIENYCNFDILNINQGSQQSYLNLVDILMEAKREDKENQLIIIDPWSKYNKIIDLTYHDDDVCKTIKEKNHGKCTERELLNVTINSMLIESLVSNDFNYQEYNPFSDFNNSKIVVSLDYPLGKSKPPLPPKKNR